MTTREAIASKKVDAIVFSLKNLVLLQKQLRVFMRSFLLNVGSFWLRLGLCDDLGPY